MGYYWTIPWLAASQHFELASDYFKVTVNKGSLLDYTVQREGGRIVVRHENGGSVTVADSTTTKNGLETLVLGEDTFSINYITTPTLIKETQANALYITPENTKDNMALIDCSIKAVESGVGNDSVYILGGKNTLIKTDEGNDIIAVFNSNDNILVGGTGDDYYKVMQPISGTITIEQRGASEYDKDVLLLAKVKKQDINYVLQATNLILSDKNGKGEIRINNYLEQGIEKIVFADGIVKADEVRNILQEMQGDKVTGVDIMKSFLQGLVNTTKSGTAALDDAIKQCSGGRYSTISQAINEFKQLCTTYAGTTEESISAFLNKYCGIDLDNADTGAITGYDAGGIQIKTATSVVSEPKNLSVNALAYKAGEYKKTYAKEYYVNVGSASLSQAVLSSTKEYYTTTINGMTYYWSEDQWASMGISTQVGRQIVGGILKAWAESSMNLIEESYGLRFDSPSSVLNTASDGSRVMYIILHNESGRSAVAEQLNFGYSSNRNEALLINASYFLDGVTDINGLSKNVYLDRTIAHEMTHGVMMANIQCSNDLPSYIMEGFAELVHGIDDKRKSTIISCLSSSSNLDIAFSSSSYNSNLPYAGGYVFLRYLAKTLADGYNKGTIAACMPYVENVTEPSLEVINNAALSFNSDISNIGVEGITQLDSNKPEIMIFGSSN